MGWKAVKDYYRIRHIVQIRGGLICIGSGYVHDLIRVGLDGHQVEWGNLGPSSNDDLSRYYAEMTADRAKLRALIEAPDTFDESILVYTYDGGEIIEKQCEKPGYPNCTHDGELMYENTFFVDKAQAVAKAKREASLGIKYGQRSIDEAEQELAKRRSRHEREKANLAKLEAEYPDVACPDVGEIV